jgi:steroid delta-isomerase-like uncharacterized protein
MHHTPFGEYGVFVVLNGYGEHTVSEQENEALVRWFFEEAWGKGNLAAVNDYIAADYVEHTLPSGSQQGREALKHFVAMYHEAFPDKKVTMHDIFGQADRAAYRWSAIGTHLGELMGIPPTGLHMTTTGITIHRIVGGKCVEGWASVDISRSEEEQRWLSEGGRTDETYLERVVGGDFYDFVELSSGRLGLIVGDATGHGMPAALVMATTRSMLRAVVQSLESPGEVLARVNEAVVADIPPARSSPASMASSTQRADDFSLPMQATTSRAGDATARPTS